jgi:hypothetical protein
MIRRPKKRNPDNGLITTRVEPKKGKYNVSVFAGPNHIRTYEGIESKHDAISIADIAKFTLNKELKKAKRSNPDYELQDSLKKAIGSSMGLPDDKREAFELGRLYGIQVSLKEYCGALNFIRRRKVLKSVDNAISESLGRLARTVLVRGEGIEGPIPIVSKRTKSS